MSGPLGCQVIFSLPAVLVGEDSAARARAGVSADPTSTGTARVTGSPASGRKSMNATYCPSVGNTISGRVARSSNVNVGVSSESPESLDAPIPAISIPWEGPSCGSRNSGSACSEARSRRATAKYAYVDRLPKLPGSKYVKRLPNWSMISMSSTAGAPGTSGSSDVTYARNERFVIAASANRSA